MLCEMQSSPCPFPTKITITPRAPLSHHGHLQSRVILCRPQVWELYWYLNWIFEQTSTFTFRSIHIIYLHHRPPSIIPQTPPSLTPDSSMNNPTTYSTHCKLHFPPLNLYIHHQTPSPLVDIMLAIISWLLKVHLNTVYLPCSLRIYHHRLQ